MPNNEGHDLTRTANFITIVHAAFCGLSKCINVLKVLTLFPKIILFYHNHSLNCGSSRLLYENEFICESHKPELHPVGGPAPRLPLPRLHIEAEWFGSEGAFPLLPFQRGTQGWGSRGAGAGPGTGGTGTGPGWSFHPATPQAAGTGLGPAARTSQGSPSSGFFLTTFSNPLHCLHCRGPAGSLPPPPQSTEGHRVPATLPPPPR